MAASSSLSSAHPLPSSSSVTVMVIDAPVDAPNYGHSFAAAPMVDPYVLTATSSIERRWLSLYRRLWRYRYMRRATIDHLREELERVMTMRHAALQTRETQLRLALRTLSSSSSSSSSLAAAALRGAVIATGGDGGAVVAAPTRDQLHQQCQQLYIDRNTVDAQWLARRRRTMSWLDATALKLWRDMIRAIYKTHTAEQHGGGDEKTTVSDASLSLSPTPPSLMRDDSKRCDDDNDNEDDASTPLPIPFITPSFVPINKKDAEYKTVTDEYGASSTKTTAAINHVYQTIRLLPTELPFTVITTQFGWVCDRNFYGEGMAPPTGRRPIMTLPTDADVGVPPHIEADIKPVDDLFAFDIINPRHTRIRLIHHHAVRGSQILTNKFAISLYHPNGRIYRCSATGIVITDGTPGRYYVSVAYRPLVRGDGADWSITVTAAEATDMITRYRDVQLMMFGHVYETMVMRYLQSHRVWLRHALYHSNLSGWRCHTHHMITALMVASSRLTARESLRRLLLQPSTVYHERVNHWRHHLSAIFARADEPIHLIIDYLTRHDHVIIPSSQIRDTMTISRYDTPPLYRPGLNVEYGSPQHLLSAADAIPITLRWDRASMSLQRVYDTRTSLTIEWPLRRPQPSEANQHIPTNGISHWQRVTLYDDGTCWIYNHMSTYGWSLGYAYGRYTLTPCNNNETNISSSNSSSSHTSSSDDTRCWLLVMHVRFVWRYGAHSLFSDHSFDAWYQPYELSLTTKDLHLPHIELRTLVSHAMLFDRNYVPSPAPAPTPAVPCWYRRVIIDDDTPYGLYHPILHGGHHHHRTSGNNKRRDLVSHEHTGRYRRRYMVGIDTRADAQRLSDTTARGARRQLLRTYAVAENQDIPMTPYDLSVWCEVDGAISRHPHASIIPYARRIWSVTDVTTDPEAKGRSSSSFPGVGTVGERQPLLSISLSPSSLSSPAAIQALNRPATYLIPTIFCDRPDLAFDALLLHDDPYALIIP